jgi:hypothetical protein
MPFELSLPHKFRQAKWKAKIREKETREPPHLTLLKKTQAWRIDLRTTEFMDAEPDPAEVPKDLVDFIRGEKVWQQLCDEWDKKYPKNPVMGDKEIGDEKDPESDD